MFEGGIYIRKLLIVGAGGHGRCCLDIARDMHTYQKIAFLDDHHVNEWINDCQVIGTIDEMSSYYIEYTEIFIAIGDNELRKKLILKAKEIGYTIVSLISLYSYISKYASLGEGIVIFPYTVIEANASIGNGSVIASQAMICHDAVIDDYCLIHSGSLIRPKAVIGSMSSIGGNCIVRLGTKVQEGSCIKDGSVIEPSYDNSFEVEV